MGNTLGWRVVLDLALNLAFVDDITAMYIQSRHAVIRLLLIEPATVI